MTPVTETHPYLLGARADMAELNHLVEVHAHYLAGEADTLSILIRQITQGHTPETLTGSARSVMAAGDAHTKAFFLSLRVREIPRATKLHELMASVVAGLTKYERATLDEDAALWMNGVPAARAAEALAPHT